MDWALMCWVTGCFIYLTCGYLLGRLSLRVFHRWYGRALVHLVEHHSPHFGERLLEYLLFPLTSFLSSATFNDLEALPVHGFSQDEYLILMSALWPLKVLWNVPFLLFSVVRCVWIWLVKK